MKYPIEGNQTRVGMKNLKKKKRKEIDKEAPLFKK